MTNGVKMNAKRSSRGMTIVELSLVIVLLLGMASFVYMSLSGVKGWKLGKQASEDLRSVYVAQKIYLADHPTDDPADFVAADLIPYLPSGAAAIPTVESMDGDMLVIKLDVMPPIVTGYDPSGRDDDGLWDVGKP